MRTAYFLFLCGGWLPQPMEREKGGQTGKRLSQLYNTASEANIGTQIPSHIFDKALFY